MFKIIFILIGLYILKKGRINFSNNRELVKPKSTYIGVIFLLSALVLFVFPDSGLDFIIGIVVFIVIFITSYFLSENSVDENIIKSSYLLITIAWLVLLLPSFFISVFALAGSGSIDDNIIKYILIISISSFPASLLVGIIAGFLNIKKNKNYILVYLPFLNLILLLVSFIINEL